MNEIKQQKIKLNEDTRNSTNYKNKYDELNNILSVIERIDQVFEYKFLSGKQVDESELPKWVNIKNKRFNEILSTVIKTKNEGLKTNVDGREMTLDNAEKLIKDLGNGILDGYEFKKNYSNTANDAEAIVNKSPLTRSQNKMLETLLLLKEILKPKRSDEQPDTTDMPKLESEESAAERRNKKTEKV